MLLDVFGVIVRFVSELSAGWKIVIFLVCLGGCIWLVMEGIKKSYNPKKSTNVRWVLFVFAVILLLIGLFFIVPINELIP